MHRLLLAVAAITILSGCLLAPEAERIVFIGTRGQMTFGYAYDGVGQQLGQRGDGVKLYAPETALRVELEPTNDRGRIYVVLHGASSCDGIYWDTFGGPQAQQGGIATDVTLHGSDGPDFPQVHARAAAWGAATLYANSAVLGQLPEPESVWDAHLFIIDQGIRVQDKILNRSSQPYDPTRPADAAQSQGGREIHMRLTSLGPEDGGFDLRDYKFGDAIMGVNHRRVFPFHVPADEGVVKLSAEVSGAPGDLVSRVQFEILQDGRRLERIEMGANSKMPISFKADGDAQYSLVVHGNSTGVDYRVFGQLHVERLVMNLWWEEVRTPTDSTEGWVPSRRTCPPDDKF